MELFSLLAKLTLDKSEFDKQLGEAQRDAGSIDLDTPSLGLDTEDFESGVEQADTSGKLFGASMEGMFNQIKNALQVTGIVGLVTGVVSKIKEAVDMTAQTADGIDKGSKSLGISAQKYQEWDHALRQSGASVSDLSIGVRNFNAYVSSFSPGAVVKDATEAAEGASGDMAQAFARLKINVKDANGQLKSTETLLEESLYALAGFEGSKEERGTLVTQLFGRSGSSLNALLDEGVDGVKALMSEAGDLGLVMSDEEISQAVAYGDAVANLQEELAAIQSAFVGSILPTLTSAVEKVTNFLATINPRNGQTGLGQILDQINEKALASSKGVDQAKTSAKKLVEDLQKMGDYWTLDEEGKMTWDALAARALELFGNTQEIEANIDAWARLEKQRILSTALEDRSEAIAKQLTSAYDKGAQAAVKEDEAYGKMVSSIQEVNDVLAKNEELRNAIYGAYGVTKLNEQNAPEILQFIHDKGFETVGMDSLDEYITLSEQAESMRTEADKLITEAEAAQDTLKTYETELSKQMGLTSADVIKSKDAVEEYKKSIDGVPSDVYTNFHQSYDDQGYPHSYAIGSRYIPYDQPAILHRGEVVQTATQARQNSESVDIAAFENAVLRAVQNGMENAQVNAYVSERDVATGTNRYNGSAIDSGRFRP